jgi:hypothetical protein
VTAATWNITIEQGATFRAVLAVADELGPVTLTGYSAAMQVREEPDFATVLLDLTSTNGGITINGPAGTLSLLVSATVTAALDWTHAVYDLLIVAPGGDTTRLVEGSVTVDPGVTR